MQQQQQEGCGADGGINYCGSTMQQRNVQMYSTVQYIKIIMIYVCTRLLCGCTCRWRAWHVLCMKLI